MAVKSNNSVAFKFSKEDQKRLMATFSKLGDSLQRQVQRKIMNAVATDIKKEYRKRTPESSKTKTNRGWSKKVAAQRDGKHKLKKSLVTKPSSKWQNKSELRRRGIIGTTAGYDYTRGNPKSAPHAHLVNDGHVAYYWGHYGGGKMVGGIHWQKEARKESANSARKVVFEKAKQAIAAAVINAAKKGNR